jgi:hypothetical protein
MPKIIRKSTFTRQVVLNLILDGNYILTGYAIKVQFQNWSGDNKEMLYKFGAVTRSVLYNIPS